MLANLAQPWFDLPMPAPCSDCELAAEDIGVETYGLDAWNAFTPEKRQSERDYFVEQGYAECTIHPA